MITPLVSVCVQTYQHVRFIRECLDGILMQQTDFSFEILLGEDCSTDGTREICVEYAEKHPEKIRLFLHTRDTNISIDGEPSGRFNLINNLTKAEGKYIALCEGDDCWISPHKLQKQIAFLEKNPAYSMSFHDVRIIGSDKLPERFPDILDKSTFTITDLFRQWFIPTCSMVFRNEIILPEWFTDVASGDIALHFLIAQRGDIKYFREISGIYRIHSRGLSRSHIFYRKAIAMSRLYHYIDLHFERKYRALINKAIETEIYTHVVYPYVKEVEEKRSWLKSPLVRDFVHWLRGKFGENKSV